MNAKRRRLKKVEKTQKTPAEEQVKVVVNWDEHPSPPEPGVIVVTWEDIGEVYNGEDEEKTP